MRKTGRFEPNPVTNTTHNHFGILQSGLIKQLFLFWLLLTVVVANSSELKGKELANPPAMPAKVTKPGKDSRPLPSRKGASGVPKELPRLGKDLSSYNYLSRTGGIAFGRVAEQAGNHEIVKIKYEANSPNGKRLRLFFDGPKGKVTITAPLPDWMLVPIARIATYNEVTLITAFGHLPNPDREETLNNLGYFILNYHPYLKDTLLGLRLMQADMLVFRPEAADFPRNDDGDYWLGLGETAPDATNNEDRLEALFDKMATNDGYPFQSYVITDHQQSITFDMKGDNLVLTGHPYWYSWRKADYTDSEVDVIHDEANEYADVQITLEYNDDYEALPYDEWLTKYSEDYIQSRLKKLEDEVLSKYLIGVLPEFSAELSEEILRLKGVNPAIFDVLTKMMRYTALFRRMAILDPKGYRVFVSSLDDIRPEPLVDTPSAWGGTGASGLDDGNSPLSPTDPPESTVDTNQKTESEVENDDKGDAITGFS